MIEPLADLDRARAVTPAGARVRELRTAGEALGERLRQGAIARVEVLALDRIPCRLATALDGASTGTLRAWGELERRMLFVELERGGERVRVVVDPVALGSWQRTPWGAWLAEAHPRRARAALEGARDVASALASVDVDPASIDIAVLTHLRGQDLRALIGTARGDALEEARPSVLPRARWVVSATEWASARVPHDLERAHLVRGSLERVAESRVEPFEHDLVIAGALAIVRTPGLTEGHASALVHDRGGVRVWSGHGVSAECWSPYHSRVAGLRERVRELDVEAVPRGDAFSRGDALTWMAFERAASDRDAAKPALHRIEPSHRLV